MMLDGVDVKYPHVLVPSEGGVDPSAPVTGGFQILMD